MTTWEYAWTDFSPTTWTRGKQDVQRKTLNEWGAAGWEAVGITQTTPGNVVILFKRPSAT